MANISFNVSADFEKKGITLLAVKGFIDTTTAPEFEEKFLSVLSDKKLNLVVDLKEVDYISSVGWGILISEIKRIRNKKGDLVLAGMNAEVLDVFELLNFSTILKFFPSVETAVKSGFERS